MGEIRASLYDIFGYLIPGIICFLGLKILSWSFLYPKQIQTISPLANSTFIISIGIISYLLGHFVHAFGNWLSFTKSTKFEVSTYKVSNNFLNKIYNSHFRRLMLSKAYMSLIDESIIQYFGSNFKNLSSDEKYSLIDELQIAKAHTNDREIYIYREGFYRGMIIACLVLLIALCISLFVDVLQISTEGYIFLVHKNERILAAILTFVCVIGFWRRMVRFSYYRISRAAATFILIVQNKI